MNTINTKAFWINGANVGDLLTPFILERLLNKPVQLTVISPKWLVAGSILHTAGTGDILCGVGSFDQIDAPAASTLEILTVRGPRTAAILGATAPVYGDAGLLLPMVYRPTIAITHTWGIIPHYVDAVCARDLRKDMKLIPTNLPVQQFIDAVCSCRYIASSALHGIVIAEAYGIPAVRICFPTSKHIRSFEHKHADYYEGTNRSLPAALQLKDIPDGLQTNNILEHVQRVQTHVQTQLRRLIKCVTTA